MERGLIEGKQVNEVSILSFLSEYKVFNQSAYFQLLGNIVEELKKGVGLNVPLGILSIIAYTFAKRFGASEEPRLCELYELIAEHIRESSEKGSFPSVVNVLSFLGNTEIKDEKLLWKMKEELMSMDLKGSEA